MGAPAIIKNTVISYDLLRGTLARFCLLFSLTAFLFFSAISDSYAQESQPGDACIAGQNGWYKRTSKAAQTDGGNMMFCDGANWLGFLSFTSAGNLGVWKAAPTVELDITGTGQMDALNLNGVTGLASPASSATFALDDLTDVNAAAPTDGQCLKWVNASSEWQSGACGGGLSADSVLESHLKAVNAPTDEYCLTYEATVGDFEWQTCGAGGSSLWTAGAGNDIYYNSGTPMVGIGQTNPDVTLDVTGDIEYTGTITDMSDRRLKTDIADLPPGQLEKILMMQGVSFKMKEDPEGDTEFGFIAQDVQPLYPALIYERNEGMLSMNYTGLIAPMVEAIKEQQAQIDELKARLKALEAQE